SSRRRGGVKDLTGGRLGDSHLDRTDVSVRTDQAVRRLQPRITQGDQQLSDHEGEQHHYYFSS
ncbi:MAG: hypothetical protein ACKPGI_03100, partial [Verrucomicrobiota bacterium]